MPAEKPVKVVHLITLLEFGGAQGNTIHTVRNLDKEKFDAELWTGRGAYWDKNVEASMGLDGRVKFLSALVRPVHPLKDIAALFQLIRELKKTKPAILHTHSSKAGILGRIAAHFAGVPTVIHSFHGFGFNDRQNPITRAVYVALERWTARFSTLLIFVSRSNLDTALQLGIGEPKQYRLIRSGVPLGKIKEEALKSSRADLRRQFNVPEKAKVITTIGAFKPQKNLFDFLAAAKMIKEKIPTAHFFILGDGALRTDLEKRVKELGLSDCVHMPGWREDAPQFLAASDVFAMTSLWEGLPRSLVEAMYLGLPSVCYDTDGVRDLLSAADGTLILQGQVGELARKVVELLEDQPLYSAMSQHAKEKIGPEFDIDSMVLRQENLYSELLQVDNPR